MSEKTKDGWDILNDYEGSGMERPDQILVGIPFNKNYPNQIDWDGVLYEREIAGIMKPSHASLFKSVQIFRKIC